MKTRTPFFYRPSVLMVGIVLNLLGTLLLSGVVWIEMHGVWPPATLVPGPRPLIGLHFGNEVPIACGAALFAFFNVLSSITLLATLAKVQAARDTPAQ